MSQKVLAVIVTYHPDLVLLHDNINSLIDCVDKIIVWENSPEIDLKSLLHNSQISFMTEGKNVGISVALNRAWHYAKDNGFDYLLTMDQDSIFHNFVDYINSSLQINRLEPAVIGPIVTRDQQSAKDEIIELNQNQYLITSGTLVPLMVLDIIGGYDETFMIDGIDVDFCIRAQDAGFKIYRNNNGVLLQHFGEPYTKKIFGKEYVCPNYSPNRLYGIIRNHLIIYRQSHRGYVKRLLITYIRHFSPRVLLWENMKYKKMSAIFRGLKDGMFFGIQ